MGTESSGLLRLLFLFSELGALALRHLASPWCGCAAVWMSPWIARTRLRFPSTVSLPGVWSRAIRVTSRCSQLPCRLRPWSSPFAFLHTWLVERPRDLSNKVKPTAAQPGSSTRLNLVASKPVSTLHCSQLYLNGPILSTMMTTCRTGHFQEQESLCGTLHLPDSLAPFQGLPAFG